MLTATETKNEVEVTESLVLTDEAVRLIERTIWGTEGALYEVKTYPEALKLIPDLRYLYLERAGRLIGIRILVPKRIHFGTRTLPSYYHSLFIIDAAERGKGYGKQLARATLDYCGAHLQDRGLIYAFTETGNLNSSHIKDAQGYQPIGRFHTTAFSHLFPKFSPRVSRLTSSRKEWILRRLTQQYAGHALVDFETSVLPDHYWALTDGNEIVAGVQAELQHWQIKELEGIGGLIAMRALPHIPLLRDLFNPVAFRFLKMGNIYFKNGHAAAARQLIESVLAEHRLKTAIAYLDKKSPVYEALARTGSFGIVNLLTETPVDVTGYSIGLLPEDMADLQSRPLVISPLDI